MEYEQFGKSGGIDIVRSGDEDTLLAEAVYNNKYGGITIGGGELLYEVHGDGVPRTFRNWELLESAVGFVTWGLGTLTSSTRLAIILDPLLHVADNELRCWEDPNVFGIVAFIKSEIVWFVLPYPSPELIRYVSRPQRSTGKVTWQQRTVCTLEG